MYLVVYLQTVGRFDPDAPLHDVNQPKPFRIEARLFATDLEPQSFAFTIRPNGWKVPTGHSQIAAERFGYVDPVGNAKSFPLPVVPLSNLAAFAKVARHVIVHGRKSFDIGVGTWRAQCGKSPEWISHAHETTDTVQLVRADIAGDRAPSIEEATEAIVGKRMSGADGVLALFNHYQSAETRVRSAS